MKTYAIVAAADFNASHFQQFLAAGAFDSVIAVDGGFAHLERIGCVPDTVVGDFDSLGYTPDHPCVKSFDPHKDASDLELAFAEVRSAPFSSAADAQSAPACAGTFPDGSRADSKPARVYVYGALSGRLDHTLAALQACAQQTEAGCEVTAVGDSFAVAVLAGPAAFDIPVPAGVSVGDWRGVVSVFSAGDRAEGVTERGLEYPLDSAVLDNRTTLGLSNELTGRPASVEVASGTLYVFYPLR